MKINVSEILARYSKIKKIFKSHKLRVTNGRIDVLEFFFRCKKTMSFKDLEDEFKNSDKVTLYRMLNTFTDHGVLNKIPEFIYCIKEHFNNYESFLLKNFIAEERKLIPIDYTDLKENPHFIAIVKRMKERRNMVFANIERSFAQNEELFILINKGLNNAN